MSDLTLITLNVGGVYFQTTLATLQSIPTSYFTDHPSFLSFITIQEQLPSHDKSNAYFIDRDPEMFKYILSFLRGTGLIITTGPLTEKYNQLKLLEESHFYQLTPLINTLETILHQPISQQPLTKLKPLFELLQELQQQWLKIAGSRPISAPAGAQQNLTQESPSQLIQAEIDLYRAAIQQIKTDQQVVVVQKLLALFGEAMEQWAEKSPYAKNFSQDFQTFLVTEENTLRQVVAHHQQQSTHPSHPYLDLMTSIMTFMVSRAFLSFPLSPDFATPTSRSESDNGPTFTSWCQDFFRIMSDTVKEGHAEMINDVNDMIPDGFQVIN